MREVPGSLKLSETQVPAQDLLLLVERESWLRVFLQNLAAQFSSNQFTSNSVDPAPGAFWSDVFVERRLPWRRFVESGAYHVVALAIIWLGTRFLALQPRVTAQPVFRHDELVYYTPSEYLPPLDTGGAHAAPAPRPDPEYSVQPIISLPPEADNRSQTIVMPPNVQFHRDVALPNVVALLEKIPTDSRLPIGPAPLVPASETWRMAPEIEHSLIPPPPEVYADPHATPSPTQAVIAPPPEVEAHSERRLADLNIGHSQVIAPAPQLSLDEQRAFLGRNSAAVVRPDSQVIAPPPSLGGSGRSLSGGGMIALSLHPAVGKPADSVAGNRRGSFGATPGGHHGTSGTTSASTVSGKVSGTGVSGTGVSGTGSGKNAGDLPAGLYVGATSGTPSAVAGGPAPATVSRVVNPNLIASARPPRISARPLQPESDSKLSEEERAVFSGRKFYSLSLNMPNLNSAGGSWIIRFTALKPDRTAGGPSSAAPVPADLSSPVATRKVDPAYPLELMRQNLGGTVILYAVIHADGTVGGVRVLRSIDDRLDQYASEAIAKWQFQPATRNGAPVDVEATFWIPFRPARVGSQF